MIEKEIKVMLTEEEYERLMKRLTPEQTIRQTNHYYFSQKCSEKHISVRVREVEERILLQVKLPVSTEGSLAVREERELELECVPDIIGSTVISEMCGINEPARRIGSLATERALSYRFEDVELCLDRNEYLGCVDYELEAEYTGEYPDEVIALLKEENIPTDRPIAGKYSRFLSKLKEADS